jgi:hypothetical protein
MSQIGVKMCFRRFSYSRRNMDSPIGNMATPPGNKKADTTYTIQKKVVSLHTEDNNRYEEAIHYFIALLQPDSSSTAGSGHSI